MNVRRSIAFTATAAVVGAVATREPGLTRAHKTF
jgi:hypothetical protein